MKRTNKSLLVAGGLAAVSLSCAAITHVDILVAYDTTAVKWLADSSMAAQSFAEEQIARSNEVLANSGLKNDFDFRLAGVYQGTFSHDQSKRSLQPTLTAVTDSSDSRYQAVRTERDRVNADIVVVIVDTAMTSGMLGLSNGMTPYAAKEGEALVRQYGLEFSQASAWLEWFAERAYCVVDISQAQSGYTFQHEVGHVMGAGHSEIISPNYDEPGPQLYRYSTAVMAQGSDGKYYASIMGYDVTGYSGSPHYEILPYFSSPNVINPETGDALGDADHDNVRTLRSTYGYVANFRGDAITPSPSPTPNPVSVGFVAKKTTITASVRNADSEVLGLAQFVVTATKKGVSRVSGTIIGLDGKKNKMKNAKCEVFDDGDGVARVEVRNAAVKGFDGTLNITLGSDGSISGSMGSYPISAASVGISGSTAGFWLDSPITSILGGEVLQSVAYDGSDYPLLPYTANPEAVTLGAKWGVAKAGKIKMVKNRTTGTSSIVPSTSANLSGLKLSYQAKTGTFKGSFTAYTVVNSKLKKYKFNVTGVAIDGVGTGVAVCKKAGVTIGVTIGEHCVECSPRIQF